MVEPTVSKTLRTSCTRTTSELRRERWCRTRVQRGSRATLCDNGDRYDRAGVVTRGGRASRACSRLRSAFVCFRNLDYCSADRSARCRRGSDAGRARGPPVRREPLREGSRSIVTLYEAGVAISDRMSDSALCTLRESSPATCTENHGAATSIRYYLLPLWPSMVGRRPLQASSFLSRARPTESLSPQSAARSQLNSRVKTLNALLQLGTSSQTTILHTPLRTTAARRDISPSPMVRPSLARRRDRRFAGVEAYLAWRSLLS